MTHIVAFDCDGTLIRGDATKRFLLVLRGPIGLGQDLCALAFKLLFSALGRCSTAQLKEALLNRSLQAAPPQRRESALHQLPAMLIAQLRPQAVACLRRHQQQGHRCLIVTASPEPLIAPLARHLGVDLIATGCVDLHQVGPSTPLRLTTPNCKGPEKLRRLELYLGTLPPPEQLESYGDSRGDRELLQASGHPHWRSFRQEPVEYPNHHNGRSLLPFLALPLLLACIQGLRSAAPELQAQLFASGLRLLRWLPAIYGLLAVSYIGRYARWRLLLGSLCVGRWSCSDAQGWFRGFALTASPGKLGELSRVVDLHQQLHYPRLALLQTFMAERVCDAFAVAIWLALLLPQTLAQGMRISSLWLIMALPACMVLLLRLRGGALSAFIHRHLPSKDMLWACVPGLLLSCLFWGCEAMILWVLVRILSPISIDPLMSISIYLLSGTAGMLSSLPGGIGVNEAATVALLVQEGVSASVALPIAVLRRLITPWSVVALAAAVGVFPLRAQRPSKSQAYL